MRILPFALSLSVATIALATGGCTVNNQKAVSDEAPQVAPILTSEDAIDDQTFAQPQVARVTHVDLDVELNFEDQSVEGEAVLDVQAADGAKEIILDNDGYTVRSITDGKGKPLKYELGEAVEGKGRPLTIQIGDARQIKIAYSAKDADALQWLSPEQTAGGEYPYLFSQGQAILNRTWIPTQDSPGIRQTWKARIVAPKPLDVVMSGLKVGEVEDVDGNKRAFTFEMDKPVAPYLIAIAAGDIDFRELGPRTGVWAEPAVLDRAAEELSDTEQLVEAAEALYGPYRWGRYDMIVLPPAFPYGGMENPVMTFLTPTFIAGDKSNNGLIAHELAHSWSGNLVTNAVWGDGWLNEGVTSYFENRIVEAVYGKKRAEQEAALAYANIEETLADVGEDAPGTALHTDGKEDLVGSAIAYDKGSYFLRTVENIVGRERFDAWLRQWFDNHAFQPATSAMLLADMEKNLVRDEDEAKRLMLREWIYEPGLPSNVAKPDPKAFADVDNAVNAYAKNGTLPKNWTEWTSAERQRFLDNIPKKRTAEQLATLNDTLKLDQSGNNEELFLWLELALANRYEPAVPQAEDFLARIGRAKFVRPLFTVLWDQGEWGRAIARHTYKKTRPGYHAVTRGGIDALIGKEG
ncbi:M1 family metallopeptidase [Pseudoblastomonas halimionae]|uniref:M1 family metallopeptidase n=1 Tax=Alteriqipengyuania halimionae TaxID=1926630 RepID=UPI0018F8C9D8|nr:M1 family metallopeptidase [Alteriqipengyuania halimionae]